MNTYSFSVTQECEKENILSHSRMKRVNDYSFADHSGIALKHSSYLFTWPDVEIVYRRSS